MRTSLISMSPIIDRLGQDLSGDWKTEQDIRFTQKCSPYAIFSPNFSTKLPCYGESDFYHTLLSKGLWQPREETHVDKEISGGASQTKCKWVACWRPQVWLITQLSSVGLLQSRIMVKSVITNAQFWFCVSYFWLCPETSGNTWMRPCILIKFWMQRLGKVECPWRVLRQLKKCLRGPRSRQKSLFGGTEKTNFLPVEGSKICPPGKPIVFYKTKLNNLELVARPGRP